MLPADDRGLTETNMRRAALIAVSLLSGPAVAQDTPDGFVARGNEPGWVLQISDATLSLTRMGDKGVASYPLPEPRPTATGRRYAVADGPIVAITDAICRDDATGMPHPAQVGIEVDGATLTGCGGAPLSLLTGTGWRVTDIAGAAMPADIALTGMIVFDPAGRVSGTSFCNRFTGTYVLTGEGLTFGPAAATRMACPEPAGNLEAAMLAALPRVSRFDIAEDGALVLIAGETPVLRAHPAAP